MLDKNVISKFATTQIREQLEFAREQFYLDNTWNVRRTLDFTQYELQSRGGVKKLDGEWTPFIHLSLWKFTELNHNFSEYQGIANDPVTGSITNNWQAAVSALISHELSHAIHFHCNILNSKQIQDPHGEEFLNFYRPLRENFANEFLLTSNSYSFKIAA